MRTLLIAALLLGGCTWQHNTLRACDAAGFDRGTQQFLDCINAFGASRGSMGLIIGAGR